MWEMTPSGEKGKTPSPETFFGSTQESSLLLHYINRDVCLVVLGIWMIEG